MYTNIDIISVFLEDLNNFFSIHQIAKILSMPYGTTYNRVHQLEKVGVIDVLKQGKAKLCRLNKTSPLTLAFLIMLSANKTNNYLQFSKKRKYFIDKMLNFFISVLNENLRGLLILEPESLRVDENSGELSLNYLNLFILTNEQQTVSVNFQDDISAIFPHLEITYSDIIATPSTLTGMLAEKENEAGFAVYQMLKQGIILYGFEQFWRSILLGTKKYAE